jgi:predicted DNA binding CopG/RHH family protein
MKHKLSPSETEILSAYEAGELKSVKNLPAEIKKYKAYAKETLKKNRRVNIRMSEYDLKAIQLKAMEEGIPYQTYIASVLHKVADGRLSLTPQVRDEN